MRGVALASGLGAVLILGACANPATLETARPAAAGHHGQPTSEAPVVDAEPAPPEPAPLREGERFVDLKLPVAYTPRVEGSGTDDYRCFVLDPELESDSLVAGIDIAPDNTGLVHHVIVHKVMPEQIEVAEDLDAADPGGVLVFRRLGAGGCREDQP